MPLAVLLVMISACSDAPTNLATGRQPAVGLRGKLPHNSARDETYESLGTYSLGLNSVNDPLYSGSGPTLPNRQILVRVTVTGTITVTPTEYQWGTIIPTAGSYGPEGYSAGANCYAWVMVGSSSYAGGEAWYPPSCTGANGADTLAQGYAIFAGATTINRTAGAVTGNTDCYNPSVGTGPCNTYTDDGQAVTIEKVIPNFTVTATPTSINYGDTVTVTVTVAPDTLGGKQVPWSIDSTRWVPSYGQVQKSV